MAILTTYPRIIDPFQQGTHLGLIFAYGIGIARNDNVITKVEAGTVELTDDATNYIEMTTLGAVSANTIGYTKGRIPLYRAVTAGGEIVSVSDERCFFNVGGGGGGGFSNIEIGPMASIIEDFPEGLSLEMSEGKLEAFGSLGLTITDSPISEPT